MNTADIFDLLLEKRQIALECSAVSAESLRVSLIRKFKDYKEQTEALGWFPEDLANAVVSLEWKDSVATFYLRPRKRQRIDYKLVLPLLP